MEEKEEWEYIGAEDRGQGKETKKRTDRDGQGEGRENKKTGREKRKGKERY